MTEPNTYCTSCKKSINTNGKVIGAFVACCNRFHVVGNAIRLKKEGMRLKRD